SLRRRRSDALYDLFGYWEEIMLQLRRYGATTRLSTIGTGGLDVSPCLACGGKRRITCVACRGTGRTTTSAPHSPQEQDVVRIRLLGPAMESDLRETNDRWLGLMSKDKIECHLLIPLRDEDRTLVCAAANPGARLAELWDLLRADVELNFI